MRSQVKDDGIECKAFQVSSAYVQDEHRADKDRRWVLNEKIWQDAPKTKAALVRTLAFSRDVVHCSNAKLSLVASVTHRKVPPIVVLLLTITIAFRPSFLHNASFPVECYKTVAWVRVGMKSQR